MNKTAAVIAAFAALLFAAAPARGQDATPAASADALLPPALSAPAAGQSLDCARCHQNPAMKPALQNALGVPRSLYIDPEAFRRSWHVKLGKKTDCVSCHADVTTYPHRRTKALRCADCHEDKKKPEFRAIEAAVHRSVHQKLDCNDCHDVHRNKPAREMSLEEKNAGCLKCHQYGLTGGTATFAPIPLAAYHSWHPQAALHLDRMACVVCHTDLGAGADTQKHLIRDKSRATRECSACHAGDSKIGEYLIDVGPTPAGDRGREELLQRIYLVGGTREKWIEIVGGTLVMLTAIGVGVHAAGRLLFWRRREQRGCKS